MKYQFPWYASPWLSSYVTVKAFLKENYPQKLPEFISAFDILRTSSEFRVKELSNLFDETTQEKIRDLIKQLKKEQLEKHEILSFGRLVVHDHEFFTDLQGTITDLVSKAVNEAVEPCYNFLSLYNNLGICGLHLDAPSAKWTVDYCIEQSAPCPIYFSQAQPWSEDWTDITNDWQEQIKNNPSNRFESFTLQSGQAIIFSGSSQWHYRDRIQAKVKKNFCHLLFFHFIPQGTCDLTKPKNLAKLFDIPELSEIIIKPKLRNSNPQSVLTLR